MLDQTQNGVTTANPTFQLAPPAYESAPRSGPVDASAQPTYEEMDATQPSYESVKPGLPPDRGAGGYEPDYEHVEEPELGPAGGYEVPVAASIDHGGAGGAYSTINAYAAASSSI